MSDPLAGLAALEGVASAYAAARDGIDARLRDRGLRRSSPDQTGESLLRGAHASAVLAGSDASLDDVRSEGGDDTARAVLRMQVELLGLAPRLRTSPLQAFARLHVLASGDVEQGGRPATQAGAARLMNLARTLTTPTTAPALLVAAVAHAEIAGARAFGSHDAVLARGVERLLLVERGVDPASLTVPEAGHLARRGAYEQALAGYADGGPAGVHTWLLYAAEALSAGAEASPL